MDDAGAENAASLPPRKADRLLGAELEGEVIVIACDDDLSPHSMSRTIRLEIRGRPQAVEAILARLGTSSDAAGTRSGYREVPATTHVFGGPPPTEEVRLRGGPPELDGSFYAATPGIRTIRFPTGGGAHQYARTGRRSFRDSPVFEYEGLIPRTIEGGER